jgi:hypothetical protein
MFVTRWTTFRRRGQASGSSSKHQEAEFLVGIVQGLVQNVRVLSATAAMAGATIGKAPGRRWHGE